MGEPFRHRLRVRYAECDPQGVVFNAHYLAFFDLALTELWRAAFGSYQAMIERGVDLVVGEAALRFRAPARFDDELDLEITVDRLGTTGMTTLHRILREEQLLVEGRMRHVFVTTGTVAKLEIPAWVRDGLGRYEAVAA